MKKISFLISILISLSVLLSSCNSSKVNSSRYLEAKTKNGRFVRYKKAQIDKDFLAFRKRKQPGKLKSEKRIKLNDEQLVNNLTKKELDRIQKEDIEQKELYTNIPNLNKQTGFSFQTKRQEDFNDLLKESQIEVRDTGILSDKNNSFQNDTYKNTSSRKGRKIEGFGLAGFIAGIIGFFVASIPLGIISLVFGAIGLARIAKKPDQRKGKGFSIAAIVIGIILIVATVILLV